MATNNITNPLNYTAHMYNAPNTQRSTVSQGTNSLAYIPTAVIKKKALINQQEFRYFSKLATYETIPKNSGTKVVIYAYVPMIDSRNLATQGIDQLGNVIDHGNLFGSSFDYAERQELMPRLSEIGGNANQVGMTRFMCTGAISKFGIRTTYTKDEIEFDNDPTFYSELYNRLAEAQTKIHELQILNDLLAAAATQYYCGDATSIKNMTATSVVDYNDFINVKLMLDACGAPQDTRIYGGNQNWDSTPLNAARYAYTHPIVIQHLRSLKDYNGLPAFKDGSRYLENIDPSLRVQTNELDRQPPIEVGSIDYTRFIQINYMPVFQANSKFTVSDPRNQFAGIQAPVTVYPILYVSTRAFTVLGYGDNPRKGGNYEVSERKPGQVPNLPDDHYNDTGSISIKWFYGFIALRPELIAVIWTALPTAYNPSSIFTGNKIEGMKPVNFDKLGQNYMNTITQDLPARGSKENAQEVNMYPSGGLTDVLANDKNASTENPFPKNLPGTSGKLEDIAKGQKAGNEKNKEDRTAISKNAPKWKNTGNNGVMGNEPKKQQ